MPGASRIPGTGPPTSATVPTVMVVAVRPGSVALAAPAVVFEAVEVFEAVDFLLELHELATRTPTSKSGRTRLKRTLSTPEMSQRDSKTERPLNRTALSERRDPVQERHLRPRRHYKDCRVLCPLQASWVEGALLLP